MTERPAPQNDPSRLTTGTAFLIGLALGAVMFAIGYFGSRALGLDASLPVVVGAILGGIGAVALSWWVDRRQGRRLDG